MHFPRRPKSRCETGSLRKAVQARGAVVLEVLAGVKYVETRRPKRHRRGQHQDPRVKRAAHRNPRRSRRQSQRQPQSQVRPARDAFQIAVAKKNYENQR